jgi:hypothetical protein
MATLRLGTYEVEKYGLPPACARCGEKAVASPPKRFRWSPPWLPVLILLGAIGLILYIVLAASLSKRRTVPLPLCERHRNYWLNRNIFLFGGLLGIILFSILGIVLGIMLDDKGITDGAAGWAGLSMAGVFLVWLVAAAIIGSTSIRATDITDRTIALTGLSAKFVDAVQDARSGDERDVDEDENEEPRRRRRRPRDDDEEDEAPRARRREKADDGGYYDRDEAQPRRRPPPDAIEEGGER